MMLQSWYALPLLLCVGGLGWLYASARRNVNIVDTLWPLFFLLAAGVYLIVYSMGSQQFQASSLLLFMLVAVWAIRLSVHLTLRNANKPEDRRYAAMRQRNPHFNQQSLFTVFGLQAVLAWILSMPLAASLLSPQPFNVLHAVGILLFAVGLFFEVVADRQLERFKAQPDKQDKVLDTGLWRYSRHPNYFGEALVWWAFYVYALGNGAVWTVFSPILMTLLLLKVSGVNLLEKDIGQRRPAYHEYIKRTSSFIPWRPKQNTSPALADGEPS